ncbi:beta-carotene 15,15'-monooxygenase [Planobacterium oryzisoli]|uniref:Beta-carotene 15,15'-monooxygenase n=1 Tax=Planobacterium oryzisoli TaxID=2771435 RepID=A0A930YUD9_9FLAO|nr:beta-carotene 15,15'-monooxygenase [Planobacterium oryzisoli]MBF5026549.1 beta-carotene 15,15'-monooxygenase [Planobacterium oryzisoli]
MDNFDLDSIKQKWKEQDVPTIYQDTDIQKMLNHKSRNYVKYIFWISALEFLIFLLLNIYYIFQDSSQSSLLHILQRMGVENTVELQADFAHLLFGMKIFSLLMTGIFVILFYVNYCKIKVQQSLKSFITQILKFRKVVNLFILTNIALLLVYISVLCWFIFYIFSKQNIAFDGETLAGFIVGLAIATAIGIGLIWLYYRVVYGIIMHRLGKNLEQLKKIEQQKDI